MPSKSPSFSSAAGELRELARTWRKGREAFGILFEVKPYDASRPYNEVVFRPSAPIVVRVLYEEVNKSWIGAEVRIATKDLARRVRDYRHQVLADYGTLQLRALPMDVRSELRTLRNALAVQRALKQKELSEGGGILGQLNRVQKRSEGAKLHQLLTLWLGQAMSD